MIIRHHCTAERQPALRTLTGTKALRNLTRVVSTLGMLMLANACSQSTPDSEPTYRTREELLNPETCRECHPNHYREWSGSMHAYAAKDPIFLAMNRRGQRDTGKKLGSFCVNCHAPLAVREAERTGTVVDDWSNFNELPYADQGVGCYFCHNISSVEGTHNAQLTLANDVTMRGSISNAVPNSAHASAASPYLTSGKPESAAACGACHDIVLDTEAAPPSADGPVELERTYREWLGSTFADPNAGTPITTCAGCHMPTKKYPEVIADVPGLRLPVRPNRAHGFPAVDLAFPSAPSTADPGESAILRAEQEELIRELLDNTLSIELCVVKTANFGSVEVTIDNSTAGHNWPSGASQDRRAWVEVTAYRNGQVLYTNAVEGDKEPPADAEGVQLFRDRIFNGDREVHMFWEATRREEGTIGPHKTLRPSDPTSFNSSKWVGRFPGVNSFFLVLPGDDSSVPDRVTVRVRLRAMGHEVLDDLIQSQDLDPAFVAEIPTFDVLPNRRLREQIPSFGTVSMEWSESVKAAAKDLKGFAISPLGETREGRQYDCISMI